MLRICVLNSGSNGNAVAVETERTGLLIDCGITVRQMRLRSEAVGFDLRKLRAVLITHEHADHVRGIPLFLKRYPVPVIATRGTLASLPSLHVRTAVMRYYSGFRIDDLLVTPIPLPHDCDEPSGFQISSADGRVVIATDLGVPTMDLLQFLRSSDVAIVEANHDIDMLLNGPYPEDLKVRIAGPFGHLSNDDAGRTVMRSPNLRQVLLAHLSGENNRPDLALATVTRHVEEAGLDVEIGLTYRDRPTEWVVL